MFCGTVYKVCRLSCQDLLLVPLLGYCQAELTCHSLAVFSLPWSLLSSVDAHFRSSSAGVMSWGLGSVCLFSSSSKCFFHLLLVVFLFVNIFTFVRFDALFCYLIGLCILYFCFVFYALVLLDLTFAFLSFLSITFLSVSFVIHFWWYFFTPSISWWRVVKI